MGLPEASTNPSVAEPDLRRLIACPRCGYRLHGLAMIHPCPECGTPLDRRWQVLGLAGVFEPPPARYMPFLNWLGLAVLLGGANWKAPTGRFLAVISVPAGILFLLLLRQWYWHRHRDDFLALGQEGLVWDRAGTGRRTISWTEIVAIRRRRRTSLVYLLLRDGKRVYLPLSLLYRRTPDEALADYCIQILEDWRRAAVGLEHAAEAG